MGCLTTHVLDTMHGRPAAGMLLKLYRVATQGRHLLGEFCTNLEGRCAAPMLEGASLLSGQYEIEFALAHYYRALGVALPDPPFLDIVTLRFGIADANQHYHVPLVASPWAYSTYRGS